MQQQPFSVCGSCPLYNLQGFSDIRTADVLKKREREIGDVSVYVYSNRGRDTETQCE